MTHPLWRVGKHRFVVRLYQKRTQRANECEREREIKIFRFIVFFLKKGSYFSFFQHPLLFSKKNQNSFWKPKTIDVMADVTKNVATANVSPLIQWVSMLSAVILGNCICTYMRPLQSLTSSHHYVMHTIPPEHLIGAFGTVVVACLTAYSIVCVTRIMLRWFSTGVWLLGMTAVVAFVVYTNGYNPILAWAQRTATQTAASTATAASMVDSATETLVNGEMLATFIARLFKM